MNWKSLFFSFDGRINRAKFWLASLALIPVCMVALVLDFAVTGSIGPFYLLAVLACIIPSFALNIKRCHDRNRSGWFILLCLVPIVSLWYLVEIGFLRGTAGPNRFGADPLATPPEGQKAAAAGTV